MLAKLYGTVLADQHRTETVASDPISTAQPTGIFMCPRNTVPNDLDDMNIAIRKRWSGGAQQTSLTLQMPVASFGCKDDQDAAVPLQRLYRRGLGC